MEKRQHGLVPANPAGNRKVDFCYRFNRRAEILANRAEPALARAKLSINVSG